MAKRGLMGHLDSARVIAPVGTRRGLNIELSQSQLALTIGKGVVRFLPWQDNSEGEGYFVSTKF